MTVTAMPLEVTLSPAEQQELLKFLKNPMSLIPVANEPLSTRKKLIESLASKDYIYKAGSQKGYTFYCLNKKAL